MRVLRLRSGLDTKTMFTRLDTVDAVAVRPDAIGSVEEAGLALHLAQRAFANKTNIAKKLKYEFLLWLSGKTDIASAMKITAPVERSGTNGNEFLVVDFSGRGGTAGERDVAGRERGEMARADVVKLLEAKELPLKLENEAKPLALERISLSRIR